MPTQCQALGDMAVFRTALVLFGSRHSRGEKFPEDFHAALPPLLLLLLPS